MFNLENIDKEKLRTFCQKNGIKKLSVFGSALGDNFNRDSDLDILVEFIAGCTPGFFGLAKMQDELSELFGYSRIDLRTPEDLSHLFRDEVINSAEVQYVCG